MPIDTSTQPTPGQQRQAAGTTPPGEVPPPSSNAQVVYTDPSGKGYSSSELNAAWNAGGAFRADPANARVGDILQSYGYGANPQQNAATPTPSPSTGGLPQAQTFQASGITSPSMQPLLNTLVGRANQSLAITPNDPIIKAQTDAATAANQRAQRSYLTQAAEQGGPNANLEGVGRSLAESGAQGVSQLQSALMGNELTARRQEIAQALQEQGSLLTNEQQMSLQRELGLLDNALRQQQLSSSNDQFAATLGLNAQNQKNYWDAIQSGLLT